MRHIPTLKNTHVGMYRVGFSQSFRVKMSMRRSLKNEHSIPEDSAYKLT